MKLNLKYLFTFFILFIVEIIIALFITDNFIRPYIGDVLVVILIYCFIRGILKPIKFLPLYLFIFALSVELAQYYSIVTILNLQDNKVISTIVGTSYDAKDILCYLIGTVILFIWERLEPKNKAWRSK